MSDTTNTLRAALLPCPFCGHRAMGPSNNQGDLWWISCRHCESEMSHGVKSALISKWNARGAAGPAPVEMPLASSRAGRVYLAGPMTGIAEFNFPAFHAAAARLHAEGLDVVNPADHGVVDGAEWADYMRFDLAKLALCESIALLPGWSRSKGARLELSVMQALGAPVRLLEGTEPIEEAPQAQPVAEPLTDELDAEGKPYAGDRLVSWLMMKWARHHEPEDLAAANWIRRRLDPAVSPAPQASTVAACQAWDEIYLAVCSSADEDERVARARRAFVRFADEKAAPVGVVIENGSMLYLDPTKPLPAGTELFAGASAAPEDARDVGRWQHVARCVFLDQFGNYVVLPDDPVAYRGTGPRQFEADVDAGIAAARGDGKA